MLETIVAFGLLLIAIGAGLVSLPAGLIVAGVEVAAAAVAFDLLQPDHDDDGDEQ